MSAAAEVEVNSALAAARAARQSLRSAQDNERAAMVKFIDRARRARWPWQRIADSLGVTDVAARRYYARNRPKMRSMSGGT